MSPIYPSAGHSSVLARSMDIIASDIPDVLIVRPDRYGDHRGFFSETFRDTWFGDAGLVFVQDNHSLSGAVGTVRGLHFQVAPRAQDKLLRVVRGAILDVAVDIRDGSPTYGEHAAVELSAENWQQLLVPRGFAHGFCTLEPDTEVLYKVTDHYAPECDRGIRWDDPALGIEWPVAPADAIVSDKDRETPLLADLSPQFTYQGGSRS